MIETICLIRQTRAVAFLEYLDRTPAAYWSVAWTVYLALLAYVAGPALGRGERPRRPGSDWVFAALVGLVLLAFRWPILFYDGELSPDESLFVVGARQLARHGGSFWQQVFGGTSGPLNFYPLLVIRFLGGEIGYGTVRGLGLFLAGGMVFFQYRAAGRWFGRPVARLGALPFLSFFAFSTFWDFVHLSSEQVALFLFSLALWLASGLGLAQGGRNSFRLVVTGVVAGMMPFAKIQAVPLSGAVFVLAATAVWRHGRKGASPGAGPALAKLSAGYLVVPALVLAAAMMAGAAQDFFDNYVRANLVYAGGVTDGKVPAWQMLGSLYQWGGAAPGFNPYWWGGVFFAVLGGGALLAARKATWLLGGILLLNAVAVFTAVFPGVPVLHYLLFLVPAMGLLTSIVLGTGWQLVAERSPPFAGRARTLLVAGFCMAGLVPQVFTRLAAPNPMLGALSGTETLSPLGATYPANPGQHRLAASRIIAPLVAPGAPLAVWGWTPKLYVETETSLGVRYADTFWQIRDTPMRDYFIQSYLSDLQASDPAVFADTVGPAGFRFQDRGREGYEAFAPLKDYIDRHYLLIADVDGVRVFASRSRQPAGLGKTTDVKPPFYNARGLALGQASHFSAALADFEKALRLDPGYAEARANRGCMLWISGRPVEGRAELDRALAENPDLHSSRIMRARIRLQEGDLPGALTDVREALRRAPPAGWPDRPVAEQMAKELGGLVPAR